MNRLLIFGYDAELGKRCNSQFIQSQHSTISGHLSRRHVTVTSAFRIGIRQVEAFLSVRVRGMRRLRLHGAYSYFVRCNMWFGYLYVIA